MTRKNTSADFWVKISVRSEDECWLWLQGRDSSGYGQFNLGGKKYKANRYAYILTKGEIPVGMLVCHSCDIPSCCNPKHLWLGTYSDNMADCIRKGRKVSGALYGADHPRAKLNERKVLRIMKERGAQSDIARKYGITQSAVHLIKSGKTWSTVTGLPRKMVSK